MEEEMEYVEGNSDSEEEEEENGQAKSEVYLPGQAMAEGEELGEIPGSGLELTLGQTVWRLGRPEFALSAAAEASAQAQHTVLSQNGQKVAGFLLREEFKADAADEVASLLADGYEIHLLSGDGQAKVDAAAVALGLTTALLVRKGLFGNINQAEINTKSADDLFECFWVELMN